MTRAGVEAVIAYGYTSDRFRQRLLEGRASEPELQKLAWPFGGLDKQDLQAIFLAPSTLAAPTLFEVGNRLAAYLDWRDRTAGEGTADVPSRRG